jgi:hypothetical protein
MDPDRQDLEMPIRIRIRQNDADPTGSESTTLQKNATIRYFLSTPQIYFSYGTVIARISVTFST